MPKFNNSEVEQQLMELLEQTPIPCSVDYVAQHLGMAWGTARAILLDLVVRDKIKTQKTTKGLIFWIEKKKEVKSAW